MTEQITTIAERDALPVGSIVIDAYAATCIRARMSDPAMPSDWVRVTSAVKGGEHHHGPLLPADVERIGWSGYQSTQDAPARTEPTEPVIPGQNPRNTEPTEEQVVDVLNRFLLGEGWHERRIAENMARAVLALGLPQRVAPSVEEVALWMHDNPYRPGGDPVTRIRARFALWFFRQIARWDR